MKMSIADWIRLCTLISALAVKAQCETNVMGAHEQSRLFNIAAKNCSAWLQKDNFSLNSTLGAYCRGEWDSIMCWPHTPAGQIVTQKCADYVFLFKPHETAYRECRPDGSWGVHPATNSTYSNYTQCYTKIGASGYPPLSSETSKNLPNIVLIYNSGYSVSILLLVFALIIMIGFRKLHCTRNYIHINLFLSFLLRAVVVLLHRNLFIQGLGFISDLREHPDVPGYYIFDDDPEKAHIGCKFLSTLMHYVIVVNLTWIFLEGLYLHNLIFVRVFSQTDGLKWYIMGGWLCPMIPVIAWVITRLYTDNEFCWTMAKTSVNWITRGPPILLMLLNFAFFINVLRVVCRKVNSPIAVDGRRERQLKLAKSTLVLIPLFGVYYMITIFLIDDDDKLPTKLDLFQLYLNAIFNAWSGALVAVLFCFLNGEVRAECRKKWPCLNVRCTRGTPRRRLSRGSSVTGATGYSTVQRGNSNAIEMRPNKAKLAVSMGSGEENDVKDPLVSNNNVTNANGGANFNTDKRAVEGEKQTLDHNVQADHEDVSNSMLNRYSMDSNKSLSLDEII